jgi:hypothetical protein
MRYLSHFLPSFCTSFLLVFLLISCSTNQLQFSAKSLKYTQESAVIAASTIDEMCTQGILTQEQCNEASNIYEQAKETYTLALETQLSFIEAKQLGNEEEAKEINNKYDIIMQKFKLITRKLVKIVRNAKEN